MPNNFIFSHSFLIDEEMRQKILDETLDAEGIQREQSNSTLWKVFQKVTQNYKQKPVVLDADDLQRNPGEFIVLVWRTFKLRKSENP